MKFYLKTAKFYEFTHKFEFYGIFLCGNEQRVYFLHNFNKFCMQIANEQGKFKENQFIGWF